RPAANRGGEVLDLDRRRRVDQYGLVALVEVVASTHRRRDQLDVRDRDVAGVERLRRTLVALQEPRGSHEPRRGAAHEATARGEPGNGTQTLRVPRVDRVAVADRSQQFGVEALLRRPELEQASQTRSGRPGG